MSKHTHADWEGGKCRVPMWMGGLPSGFCDKEAHGPQLPRAVLRMQSAYYGFNSPAYCVGPCCPDHGGPSEGEPIVFQDGYTPEGRPMWCAVMPGFINLQESLAAFSGKPAKAISDLRAAIAKAEGGAA